MWCCQCLCIGLPLVQLHHQSGDTWSHFRVARNGDLPIVPLNMHMTQQYATMKHTMCTVKCRLKLWRPSLPISYWGWTSFQQWHLYWWWWFRPACFTPHHCSCSGSCSISNWILRERTRAGDGSTLWGCSSPMYYHIYLGKSCYIWLMNEHTGTD